MTLRRSTLTLCLPALIALIGCDADRILAGGNPASILPDAGDALDAEQAMDARAAADAGDAPDSATPDAAPDAGGVDAATLDAGAADAGIEQCGFDLPGPPDRDRVVLVGHGLGAMVGTNGTEIRSLLLRANGDLVDVGRRLDIGDRPARIAFVPSGEYAVVVGEGGRLVSVRIDGPTELTIIDAIDLPSAGFEDLRIAADGQTTFAVGSNVGATSGISTVRLGCNGRLTEDAAAFFNLRLTQSLAFLPGEQRALLLGGQAVFDPVDDDDVRLLQRSASGWTSVGDFDLWTDFVSAGRIAVSPDGSTGLLPNNSLFSVESGQLMIVSIVGDQVTEVGRLSDLSDPSEVLYSTDGATVLLSQPEANEVTVYSTSGAALVPSTRIAGIGLADQMAIVRRGVLAGTVLLSSTDPNGGPNVAMIRIRGAGLVDDLGQVELGGGGENIPDAIGVMP